MILILSEENDYATNDVIDWLRYYGIRFFRINESDSIRIIDWQMKESVFEFDIEVSSPYYSSPKKISSKEISAYWYRRGFLNIRGGYVPMPTYYNEKLNRVIQRINCHLRDENMRIVDFLHFYFGTIKHIGCFYENLRINKMKNLYLAKECGIKIPDFIVTSSKKQALLFVEQHPICVVKGIEDNSLTIKGLVSMGNLAKLITKDSVSEFPDKFDYSLIQEYIDKKVDLRVFFLDGKAIPTAIFSQNDPQTRVDFRNYNQERPNRIVPFKMTKSDEEKLQTLMRKLNYVSGSIDYVLDAQNNLIFLEINPIGQFGFISDKCNLYIPKSIAEYFTI